jgi:hypothetical protein
MSSSHLQPDLAFDPAPLGTRVRLITVFSVVATVGAMVAGYTLMLRDRHPPPWPVWAGLPFIPLLVAAIWHFSRVRGYRLVGNELRVERAWRTLRFPLDGLTEVMPDRAALRWALKIQGNDGLGAIAGRYRSRRLGPFRAYLTDPENAVVLRWPSRCLVISPRQPAWFVEAVRKRAGLAG